MTPYTVLQKFLEPLALLQPSFTHTHVLNKDTYVDHF